MLPPSGVNKDVSEFPLFATNYILLIPIKNLRKILDFSKRIAALVQLRIMAKRA